MKELIKDCQARMDKALQALSKDFTKLRTGRASASLLEDLKVDYYGTPTPLQQIASISVPDSRTLAIQPWDKGAFSAIEKSIQKSDLGLNPINDGKLLRIVLPPLTGERRKELAKVAKKYAEDAKVAIRNVRRDLNDALKKMKLDGAASEDDIHKTLEEVQKITDAHVAKADALLEEKEKEIMEI